MIPWLSVVVPIHDGARYLEATLASAAAERPDGVEFLLYDSGDDNGACRSTAERFESQLAIRYVATPECKPWTAKSNRGVSEAAAPHIAMLHQDDLWLPGHIAALRAALAEAPGCAMSVGPSTFIGPAGQALGRWRLPFAAGLHDGAQFAASMVVQNTIAIPSPVIRRDAWLAVGGMDEPLWYTADWDLYLKLAGHGPVHVRAAATTAFRLHRSSLTITGSRRQDDFRTQQETVLDRHLPALPQAARRRQEGLARAAIATNCALAARAAGQPGGLVRALRTVARLGPLGITRFLHATRLIDRTLPRLRLNFAGEL
jgi:glycosyltransferase involved in cell wall biosynthesis